MEMSRAPFKKYTKKPKTSASRTKYYDNHTLYVTSGVAKETQLYDSLQRAIEEGELKLNHERLVQFAMEKNITDGIEIPIFREDIETLRSRLNEMFKRGELDCAPPKYCSLNKNVRVNLIVNKNGEYYGFGYIRVASEEVYWMLLGRNPDGSERIREYPDPNWSPPDPKPTISLEEEQEKFSQMNWYEIIKEEDKYVQPIIRESLPPLMTVPGYEYDPIQYKHLQEIASSEGKRPENIPTVGYFEFSRAYARDLPTEKTKNILCARQVPSWIPLGEFKRIFNFYTTSSNTEYPKVKFVDKKTDTGKVVFIVFDPTTKDAVFALLMTRKVRIIHPSKPELECTLIFDHAYSNIGKSPGNSQPNPLQRSQRTQRSQREPRRNKDPNIRRRNISNPTLGQSGNRTNRDRSGNRNTRDSRDRSGNRNSRDRRDDRTKEDDVDLSKYNYTRKQN